MNKDKINSKIEDLETELAKLKKLANERVPKAGEVWIAAQHKEVLVDTLGQYTYTEGGYSCSVAQNPSTLRTYLGKFNEVYVKISDVQEALSICDFGDDSVINWICNGGCRPYQDAINETAEALRKLNIITD